MKSRMKVKHSARPPRTISVYRLLDTLSDLKIHLGVATYHPILSWRRQVSGVASVGQLKLARNTQAISDTTSWLIFHQAERAVRRYWWLKWLEEHRISRVERTYLPGTNSKKIMQSTGTLPPAAVPTTAHRPLNAMKFMDPAAAQRKVPAMSSVKLKAGRRPIRSLDVPQNDAPRIRPT